jgi:hypothetical protein
MPSRAWLPGEALRGGTVERAIGEAVLRWSEKWFARQLVGGLQPPERVEPAAGAGAGESPTVHVHPDGLWVSVGSKARLAIAGMMLDAVVEPSALTAADRRLLETLADGCAEDLGREIGRQCRLSAEGSWRRSAGTAPFDAETFAVGALDGKPLLHVALDYALAVELIKSRSPVAPAAVPLRPIAEGVARQAVAVSALLGRCQLSLGDFSELAPGDVLVLDRDVEGELDLALGGHVTGARCSVEQDSDGLSLKLLDPLIG